MLTRLGYFARETIVSLRRNLLMTIAGTLTVAVSLALFGGIMLLSRWVDHGTEKIKDGVRLEIFMVVDATPKQIDDMRDALESDRQVESFRFLTKQDAHEVFKRYFRKDTDLVKNTPADALPTSFRVVPVRAEFTNEIARRSEVQPGVDEAETPAKALAGILDTTRVARLIFFGLSTVLLVSSLFLIVNTIRLATFARRREIEVMKLVGASNWFVRVPFLAESLVQGLIGAGFAVGIVVALKVLLSTKFDSATGLFKEFFVTTGDALGTCIYVLVLGAVIGLIGSTVGLRRFLKV